MLQIFVLRQKRLVFATVHAHHKSQDPLNPVVVSALSLFSLKVLMQHLDNLEEVQLAHEFEARQSMRVNIFRLACHAQFCEQELCMKVANLMAENMLLREKLSLKSTEQVRDVQDSVLPKSSPFLSFVTLKRAGLREYPRVKLVKVMFQNMVPEPKKKPRRGQRRGAGSLLVCSSCCENTASVRTLDVGSLGQLYFVALQEPISG